MKFIPILIVALFTFAITANALETNERTGAQLTLEALRPFTDVFNQLRKNFVEEVDDHSLLSSAIEGMLKELDPYSEFLDVDQSRSLEELSNGRYGGIGVHLNLSTNQLEIDGISDGGPAGIAGLRTGDIITAIDGNAVRGRKLSESVDSLLGAPGTEVKLRVKSEKNASRDISLFRDYILVPSVTSRLFDGDVGYFKISHFHRNSHLDLENEISSQLEGPDSALGGIILDLRDNPGGVLMPAIEIADGFLEQGLIVNTQGRYEATRLEFRARPGQWAGNVPMVILVNGKTASASEVLTAALQDHGRAIIIGETTFGKGSIQSVFLLRNGSTLKLTTAHYFTPSGQTIHNSGIHPDIAVNTPLVGSIIAGNPENDAALLAALDQLKSNGLLKEGVPE